MMSTAITARLEFQCGHAALVSLPRIKGETSAQRNARIAQEKTAARARPCDFCAPELEVHVEPIAAPPVALPAASVEPSPPLPFAGLTNAAENVPDAVVQPPPLNGTAAAMRPARQRRSGAPRPRRASAPLLRFTVHYRVDGVLNATDIHDALRQAESLGATELFLIARDTRER
jgi:hypothetical protein